MWRNLNSITQSSLRAAKLSLASFSTQYVGGQSHHTYITRSDHTSHSRSYYRAAAAATATATASGPASSPLSAASRAALISFAAGGSFLAVSLLSPSAQQPARAEAAAATATPISATTAAAAAAATTTTQALPRVIDLENKYVIPTVSRGLPKSIIIYQYDVCPFCCKVKTFLDYYKIPYRVVEVNPLTKSELKWSSYKKVPVVVLDDKEQVNDSSAIISLLAAELEYEDKQQNSSSGASGGGGLFSGLFSLSSSSSSSSSVRLATTPRKLSTKLDKDQAAEEEDWRRWVDERLVKVITVNIYRTAKEAFQTFDYISEAGNFGWVHREAARVVGATMMWTLSNRLKKKYKVEGDVREVLYECANEWVDAVGEKKFMGGDAPNLADLAVFGVMRSVTSTDTFMDLQHKTRVGPWYERMMGAVGDSSRIK